MPDQEEMFAGTQIKFKWSSIYHLIRKYFEDNLDPLEQILLADYHGEFMHDFIPTNEKFFRRFDLTGVCSDIVDMSIKKSSF